MSDTNVESKPILSVRSLKTYFFQDEGVVKAVDGVSFDVCPGRTLGIVGESGCGKSVTARSILRILEDTGRIIDGEIILHRTGPDGTERDVDLTRLDRRGREMRAVRGAEIALIFQEPMTSLSAHYTIGNQIIEAIRLHQGLTKSQARDRAIEVMHQVGIPQPERRIDEYSFQLSGGLRQRVVIALALSCDPKILIADEPTTALDVTTQAQILDLLTEIQRQRNMAVMLITHNMGVIAEMADDVVVMYLGRVVEKGPVDIIFHSPKHPYTRALLASIPNLLATPRLKLPTISGAIPHPYSRPQGCPFHPRCPECKAGRCDRDEPPTRVVGPRHEVCCVLYDEPKAMPMAEPMARRDHSAEKGQNAWSR